MELLKVLLIDITDMWLAGGSGEFTKKASKNNVAVNPMASYPIGLMYLSSYIKRIYGEKVKIKIINTVLDCENEGKLEKILKAFNPDVTGLRALSMHKKMFHQIASVVKKTIPSSLVIGGGPYPSTEPEDAINDSNVDIVARGEGEITFKEIIDTLFDKTKSLDAVNGIVFKNKEGKIQHTPKREFIVNLDDLPFPDYKSIPILQYIKSKNMSRSYSKHANLVTSRGCPFLCTYCHNIFGKQFRYRSAENIFEEILNLYENFGISEFQIIDDIFNLQKERAYKVFDLIIKKNLKLKFSFPNGVRGDALTKELIDIMIEGGTRLIYFAVETGSPRIQKLIQKNVNLDKLMENINYAASKNCVTGGFFMLGFPTETVEEINLTIDYALKTNLSDGYFFNVTFYPGTQLWELAVQNGLNAKEGKDSLNFFQPGEGVYDCSLEEFEALHLKARREFYFSEKRISLKEEKLPLFFKQKEISEIIVAQITGSKIDASYIKNPAQQNGMKEYFRYVEMLRERGIDFTF